MHASRHATNSYLRGSRGRVARSGGGLLGGAAAVALALAAAEGRVCLQLGRGVAAAAAVVRGLGLLRGRRQLVGDPKCADRRVACPRAVRYPLPALLLA